MTQEFYYLTVFSRESRYSILTDADLRVASEFNKAVEVLYKNAHNITMIWLGDERDEDAHDYVNLCNMVKTMETMCFLGPQVARLREECRAMFDEMNRPEWTEKDRRVTYILSGILYDMEHVCSFYPLAKQMNKYEFVLEDLVILKECLEDGTDLDEEF